MTQSPQPGPQGPGYPGGPPQQPWSTPLPPKKTGAGKWIAGVATLAVVIAVTVAVTLHFSSGGSNNEGRSGGGGGKIGNSGAASDVASANDTGPVGIITEDPSCAAWAPINNTLKGVTDKGWDKRDASAPASSWSPEVRAQYEAVGAAMRKAADQTVPLAKLTTHRVMRELYGQYVVYLRAYADSIASYSPADESLARTGVTAGSSITHICAAVSSGAAAARASLVPSPVAPASTAPVGNLANPPRIFEAPDPVCGELSPAIDQLSSSPAYKNWLATDPSVPVSEWSPEQQSATAAFAAAVTSMLATVDTLKAKSSNPIVQDFLQSGVLYQQTYIQALPTYQPNDQDILMAGQLTVAVVRLACKYTAG